MTGKRDMKKASGRIIRAGVNIVQVLSACRITGTKFGSRISVLGNYNLCGSDHGDAHQGYGIVEMPGASFKP